MIKELQDAYDRQRGQLQAQALKQRGNIVAKDATQRAAIDASVESARAKTRGSMSDFEAAQQADAQKVRAAQRAETYLRTLYGHQLKNLNTQAQLREIERASQHALGITSGNLSDIESQASKLQAEADKNLADALGQLDKAYADEDTRIRDYYETQSADIEARTVLLGSGERIDRGTYNLLSPSDQQLLNQVGISAFNEAKRKAAVTTTTTVVTTINPPSETPTSAAPTVSPDVQAARDRLKDYIAPDGRYYLVRAIREGHINDIRASNLFDPLAVVDAQSASADVGMVSIPTPTPTSIPTPTSQLSDIGTRWHPEYQGDIAKPSTFDRMFRPKADTQESLAAEYAKQEKMSWWDRQWVGSYVSKDSKGTYHKVYLTGAPAIGGVGGILSTAEIIAIIIAAAGTAFTVANREKISYAIGQAVERFRATYGRNPTKDEIDSGAVNEFRNMANQSHVTGDLTPTDLSMGGADLTRSEIKLGGADLTATELKLGGADLGKLDLTTQPRSDLTPTGTLPIQGAMISTATLTPTKTIDWDAMLEDAIARVNAHGRDETSGVLIPQGIRAPTLAVLDDIISRMHSIGQITDGQLQDYIEARQTYLQRTGITNNDVIQATQTSPSPQDSQAILGIATGALATVGVSAAVKNVTVTKTGEVVPEVAPIQVTVPAIAEPSVEADLETGLTTVTTPDVGVTPIEETGTTTTIRADTTTRTGEATQVKPAEATQTQTQTKTLSQQLTRSQVGVKADELTRSREWDVTDEFTIPKALVKGKDDETLLPVREREPQLGDAIWRQGAPHGGVMYIVVEPPYDLKNAYYFRHRPESATKFATGRGSAYRTFEIVGGKPANDADLDLGSFIARIRKDIDGGAKLDFVRDMTERFRRKRESPPKAWYESENAPSKSSGLGVKVDDGIPRYRSRRLLPPNLEGDV